MKLWRPVFFHYFSLFYFNLKYFEFINLVQLKKLSSSSSAGIFLPVLVIKHEGSS